MRVRAALFALTIAVAATAAGAASVPDKAAPGANSASNCPRTSGYFADQSSLYGGKPLGPRKLTELPPATTYMAVYRHIGVCEVPLTMTEYRNPHRR